MASSYVTLDGKRYTVFVTRYEPTTEKKLSVDVTVGGTTISQQFSFVDYAWTFDLAVEYTPQDPAYGSLADLKASYLDPYVDFVDHYGNSPRSS
jgi:hypothetical protein